MSSDLVGAWGRIRKGAGESLDAVVATTLVLTAMTLQPPLPGSIDEYETRAKLRRLLTRGGTVSDPTQARMAVELAEEELAKLPRQSGLMLLAGLVALVIGAIQVAQGSDLTGIPVAAVGVAIATLSPLIRRSRQVRLAQAVRNNKELAPAPNAS